MNLEEARIDNSTPQTFNDRFYRGGDRWLQLLSLKDLEETIQEG